MYQSAILCDLAYESEGIQYHYSTLAGTIVGFFYLAIAIVFEVAATTTLKATESFTRLWPSIAVLVCIFTSLYFFSVCLRTVTVAVAYPIWSGVGATLVTVLAWDFYGQKMDFPAIAGIALIVAGVAVINIFSETVSAPQSIEETVVANHATESVSDIP